MVCMDEQTFNTTKEVHIINKYELVLFNDLKHIRVARFLILMTHLSWFFPVNQNLQHVQYSNKQVL